MFFAFYKLAKKNFDFLSNFFYIKNWFHCFENCLLSFKNIWSKQQLLWFWSTFDFSSVSTRSIVDCQLLRQKVRQKISVNRTNIVFLSSSRKTWIKMSKSTVFQISSQVFVWITEMFWQTFWRNNWRSIIDDP